LKRSVATALAGLIAAGAGCARAVNYLDPDGPLHVHRSEAQASADAKYPGAPFRVVSFNVAYAVEIDKAIAVLRRTPELQGADVLALQEMDAPGAERIASALGFNSVYFPSGVHPKHGRDFGCAVLSPWPLEAPGKVLLPRGARVSGLRRAATAATVVRGGQRVRVYSVHLPAPLSVSGGSRREQLRVLADDAARHEGPALVVGDFNTHDGVAALALAGFSWPTREMGATTRFSFLGLGLLNLAYDHVLVRGLDAVATGVIQDNAGASDHKPIWALLAPPPR